MVVGRKDIFPGNIVVILITAACLFTSASYSQKITHVDFEIVESTVKIRYDVDECPGGETYDLRVLLGQDGELTEIRRGLEGDIQDVSCGSSKSITWDVLSDRTELKGRIYFAVEIYRTHPAPVIESKTPDNGKHWSHHSWKADKGYVGGSVGIFAPYNLYANVPQNVLDNGMFINASMGYLPSLLLGVSATVFVYSDPEKSRFDFISWKNWGVMIGPLISLPIGNRIKWEVRPQIGYAAVAVKSDVLLPDSLDVMRGGVAYNIGTGLRLNIGKRTCYMLNLEYLSAPFRFDDYRTDAELGSLGASFGIAFRFY